MMITLIMIPKIAKQRQVLFFTIAMFFFGVNASEIVVNHQIPQDIREISGALKNTCIEVDLKWHV